MWSQRSVSVVTEGVLTSWVLRQTRRRNRSHLAAVNAPTIRFNVEYSVDLLALEAVEVSPRIRPCRRHHPGPRCLSTRVVSTRQD